MSNSAHVFSTCHGLLALMPDYAQFPKVSTDGAHIKAATWSVQPLSALDVIDTWLEVPEQSEVLPKYALENTDAQRFCGKEMKLGKCCG